MKTVNRHNFLKAAGLGFTSLYLPNCLMANKNRSNKPNIILIMANDLGYECLSCNGITSYHTPNLDNLAKTGVRFDHCYSTPICTPSRMQIMTGKYNLRNYTEFRTSSPK